MKLKEIYHTLVQLGIDFDPRGKDEVNRFLADRRENYEKKNKEEKENFDLESLTNPFSDTRILYGEDDTDVRSVLVGIDIEVGELLLADRLREKGQSIDLVIAHHPEGIAMAGLHEVMHMQEELLAMHGIPINVAEGILASRIGEVRRGIAPINHNRGVDAARMLNIPFLCVHTPADNQVNTFLQKKIDETKPERVKDVLDLLKEIPEYKQASKYKAGPSLFSGKKENRCGKIIIDMTGGTSGSENAYEKLVQAGVGTIIGMHMNDKHRKEAEKHHINVVIAGHMSSDSLGMNLLMDHLEKKGVQILTCSGYMRYKR